MPSQSCELVVVCLHLKCSVSAGTCKFGPACTMYHPDADGNSVRRAPATRRAPPHTTTATAHSLFPSDADAGSRPQDSDASVSLCRAWITSGHCPKMSTCKFRHGTCGVAIGKARAEWTRCAPHSLVCVYRCIYERLVVQVVLVVGFGRGVLHLGVT